LIIVLLFSLGSLSFAQGTFLETAAERFDAMLYNPATGLEHSAMLAVGVAVWMLMFSIFLNSFNAPRRTMTGILLCLMLAGGAIFSAVVAFETYVIPQMSEELKTQLSGLFIALLSPFKVTELTDAETVSWILKLVAVLALLAVGAPLTSLITGGKYFASVVLWLIALLMAWGAMSLAHVGIQRIHGAQQIDQTYQQQHSNLKEQAKQYIQEKVDSLPTLQSLESPNFQME
jgi:hypothetical protein